jgi:hypothetical protein
METPGSAPDAADATGAPSVPADSDRVWRFLITPCWLGWHVFAVLAFWGMLWLGDWQLHRAISGNGLSWAYTFEWPLFAIFGAVFWARTIRDEFRIRRNGGEIPAEAETTDPVQALPAGLGTALVEQPADDADDAQLAKYNAYLARLTDEVKGTHGKRRIG